MFELIDNLIYTLSSDFLRSRNLVPHVERTVVSKSYKELVSNSREKKAHIAVSLVGGATILPVFVAEIYSDWFAFFSIKH